MSLDSWRDEFYEIDAREVSAQDAIQHSLTKYIGLRADNLKRHGLKLTNQHDVWDDKNSDIFEIDGHTCALCVCYYQPHEAFRLSSCNSCPIFHHNGKECMDSSSAYHEFKATGDPEPMIDLLTKLLKAWNE